MEEVLRDSLPFSSVEAMVYEAVVVDVEILEEKRRQRKKKRGLRQAVGLRGHVWWQPPGRMSQPPPCASLQLMR